MIKKIFLAVCFVLTAFFSFFDPVGIGFEFGRTALANCAMLGVMVGVFYASYDGISKISLKIWEKICAFVLGVCMTLGFSLLKGKGFDVFYASWIAVLFSLVSLAYYCAFAVFLMKFFFYVASSAAKAWAIPKSIEKCRLTKWLYAAVERNSFWFYFGFFMVAWGIVFLFNFPGIVMFDTRNQVAMFYGVENHHTNASILINPEMLITQHHSVLHTLLVGFMFKLGKDVFGTFEAGIFLYNLIQYTVMSLITAYMFGCIRKYISAGWTIFWLLLFAIHPFFGIGAVLVTKDIYFCGFFVLYMLKYYELMRNPEKFKNPGFFVSFAAITLALLLLRNNALYSLAIISLLMFVFMKGKRGCVLVYLAFIIAFNSVYTGVLLPAFEVSPGNPREMLSVPFQQTAYYVNKFGDEVTPEEKKAISAVLDYDVLINEYNPEKSDPVKDTYNKYATTDELIDYFAVWGKMLLKHPVAYVESFLSLNYGYYFPGMKTDPMNYHAYNDMRTKRAMEKDGFETLNTKEPGVVQHAYFSYQGFMYRFPFTCLITDTGIHFWIWIFMMLLIIRSFKNKKKYLMYYIPFFAYLIFILVGPVNGTLYVRYVMPFIYTLPLAFLPIWEQRAEND